MLWAHLAQGRDGSDSANTDQRCVDHEAGNIAGAASEPSGLDFLAAEVG